MITIKFCMKFLFPHCIIICYNHNYIKLVTCFFGGGVGWAGGSCPCCSPPLCTALLDVYVNRVFSQIHVRAAYLFLYLRSRYICYRKRAVNVTVPYRMLTHSHSATSLYNLSQSAISLHQLFTSCPHLTYERA
jgi:hypothetical protein